MTGRNFKILLFILCFSTELFSQTAGFFWWPLVNVSLKTKHFKFFVEEQVRFRLNNADLYVFYNDVGVYYMMNEHVNFGPVWRPWWSKGENGFEQCNLMLFDVNLKNNYKNFEYSFRTRYQQMLRFADSDPKEFYSRNKFELKYNGWKMKPFISAELFTPLFKTTPNFIDKIRNTLGLEINLTKHSAFIPLLMYIKDRSALDYQDLFIVGGGYHLIF